MHVKVNQNNTSYSSKAQAVRNTSFEQRTAVTRTYTAYT